MSELDLNDLTVKIEALLRSREQLRAENLFLRQKLLKVTHERADLQRKNDKAVSKIKRLITELRNEYYD